MRGRFGGIWILCLPITLFFTSELPAEESIWVKIDDGLFVSEFSPPSNIASASSKITIIRVNHRIYSFRLLCASEHDNEGLTVKKWCEKYGMIAAINAGMFLPNRRTNVGYMKNFSHFNNSKVNPKYYSVAAFNPIDNNSPCFKIFDSDEECIEGIVNNYNTVIQNLRLIKRPGINRWSRQEKSWSEAALGQDKNGDVLFIFTRAPFSMYDFNRILLNLPIGIVAAQHLEGGPEASLYFSCCGFEIDMVGSYETGFNENNFSNFAWSVPNVIGFEKRNMKK